MALKKTPLCNFGEKIYDFNLKSVDEKTYSLKQVIGKNGTLIMFICNHCPYVKAIIKELSQTALELEKYNVKSVAIMSNDTVNYPDDSYENMKKFSKENNFNFPYLIDETQEIAKAYGAVCTPDFFGYNSNLKLQYRGRLDESRKETAPEDVRRDLFEAMKEVAISGQGPREQIPSMGCSIKWF